MNSNISIKPSLKRDKIGLLVLIIIIGFTAAVIYHYVVGYYLGRPWPANTFLHKPIAHFWDFTLVVRQSADLYPFAKDIGGFAGSPFGQFVGYLFSVLRATWLQLFLFFGSFFAVLIIMTRHYLYGMKSRLDSHGWLALFAITFLTYPVLFAVDRGNFDLLACALIFLFAFTYGNQKYRASAVFLSLAIAIKPIVVVLGLIYLFDKRYKEILLVIFNVVFLTTLSLSLFKGGLFLEIRKYLDALSFTAGYLSSGNQQAFNSDLYGLLTVATQFIGNRLGRDVYLPGYPEARYYYAIAAIVVFIYFAVYLWRNHPPLWQMLAVLTILLILLPFNSADYRLTYLLVPLVMYLGSRKPARHELLIVILWGLLLIPKNYYTIQSFQNIGVVINPLLLIALLISIIPGAFSINGVVSLFRARDREIPAKELI
jgi:hypothetical protein